MDIYNSSYLLGLEGYSLAVPTNIKTLLAGNAVEWARIEFKETWDAEASLKTICAFANDIDNWGGGYLVKGWTASSSLERCPYGQDRRLSERYAQ